MVFISVSLILKIVEYGIYIGFLVLGTYYLYKSLTSNEERKFYRIKLIKEINERRNSIVAKSTESDFQKKLRVTGISFLSAVRYQIFRWSFIIVATGYYLILPIIKTDQFDRSLFSIPVLLILISEPKFKFSVVSKVLDSLIKRKKRQRTIELFTLFDMLKAELITLNKDQDVNIYNMLKDSITMFEYIPGTISRFLSLWKSSPETAKDVFYLEIGGESAKVLGDILFKLDNTSKDEALKILESESSIFSFSYYESELQGSIKQKNAFSLLFSVNILLIIAWLIIIVFTMFSDNLENNHFF